MSLNKLNMRMFDGRTNVTTDAGLVNDIKIYWDNHLIDLVEPKLVHSQFAQKRPIPSGTGKTIEFRKFDSLPKMMRPLTEGVTPDGQKLQMSVMTAVVDQYGGYVETSDILDLTAIDDISSQAVSQIAKQAARTIDSLDRDEMNSGTNVYYCGRKASRDQLDSTCVLTVDDIKRAVRQLKLQNAEPVDTDFVAIIHPDVTYELTKDPDWKAPHQYVDTENIYSGEIGRIAGVRFVETTEAKIFMTDPTFPSLSVKSFDAASSMITFKEAITEEQATALHGKYVLYGASTGSKPAVLQVIYPGTAGNAKARISYPSTAAQAAPAANNVVVDGGAGAGGRPVYSTLILGANAYGVTEISGGGLEFIHKELGSGGTSDPLNQRATEGWKCTRVCKILVEQYMVRVESCTTFDDTEPN